MKINRILGYFRLHSISFLRSKSGVFFVVIFPLILMLIFVSIFGGTTSNKTNLIVQNLDPGQQSWGLVNVLNHTDLFSIKIIGNNENISSAASHMSIDQGIVIPANFTANYHNNSIFIRYYHNPSSQYSSSVNLLINNILLQYYGGSNSQSVKVNIDSLPISATIPKPVDYYLPGLIGFTMLNGVFTTIYQVPNYRQKKIFRQLSFSGLTKSEWLASSTLFFYVITLISDLILYVVGLLFFGIKISLSPVNVIVAAITIFFGMLIFISLGLIAGIATKNEETASIIGNLIFFPMLFLSGVFFPTSFMPPFLLTISSFLPLTYFINALNSILIFNDASSVALDIILMGIGAAVLFGVSSYLASRIEDF